MENVTANAATITRPTRRPKHRMLGLTVPDKLLAVADEVIE